MSDNTYIVIDLETPKVVKRTTNFRAASLWADTDFAMKSTHVDALSVRAFSCLTEYSLIKLYKNTFNEDLGLRPYGEMLKACYYKALELPIDETPVATLEEQHRTTIHGLYPLVPSDAPPLPTPPNGNGSPTDAEWRAMLAENGTPAPTPAPAVAKAPAPGHEPGKGTPPPPAHRPQPSPATRPKAGTTTAKVWDIADEEHKKHPKDDIKALRARIMARCEKEGINDSTAATQFGKWKSSLGL